MGNEFTFFEAPASWIILITTCCISFYTLYMNNSLLTKMMFHPYSFFHENRLYTILTSGFVHADLMHLLFNMLTFYFFAFQLETNGIIGTGGFLLIYFGSMIFSDLPTAIKHRNDIGYLSLGASGAISGIVFSSILFNPSSKMYVMLLPIPIPASIFGILYLAYCYYASMHSNDRINHEAHFWGALTGIIITIIIYPGVISDFLRNVI